MRLSIIVKGLGAFFVVALVTLVVTLTSTDFNAYKSEVSKVVQELTDRKLVIGGRFKLSFGLTPAVAVDRVTFSNARWGSRPDMVRIKRLRAELRLFPLLFGEIRIRRVVLSGADILLETRKDGVGNWNLEPSAKESQTTSSALTFDRVLIENSTLTWRDGSSGSKNIVKIDRLRTRATAADAPLKMDLLGSYDGAPVRLDGRIDSLAGLTSNKPTSIDLNLRMAGARITAKGQIKQPITGSGVSVALTARGKNVTSLSGLFGTALPSIGPYALAANVTDSKSRWRFRNVDLKIGKSDFNGEVYVDPNPDPVRIYANLRSDLVRTVDFEEGGASAKRRRSGRKKGRNGAAERLFSAKRFPPSALDGMTVKLSLDAKKFRVGDVLLDSASLSADIRNGRLILKPASALFAGGKLRMYMKLASAKQGLRMEFKADLRKMNLDRFISRLGYRGLVRGRLNASATLFGTGRSMRGLMSGLNGRFQTTMNGGRIDNKMFSRLSGETVSAILPWSSDDKGISVKCLVGQYEIRRGRLASTVTLLDTDRLLVEGEGGIDFRSEKIRFRITPRAKVASLVNLLVPLDIGGMLASPDVSPDPAGVAKSALGFATGGILGHGLVSEVISSIVSSLSGSDDESPCIEALSKVSGSKRR